MFPKNIFRGHYRLSKCIPFINKQLYGEVVNDKYLKHLPGKNGANIVILMLAFATENQNVLYKDDLMTTKWIFLKSLWI